MADFDDALTPIPLGPRARRMLEQQRARLRVRQQRRMSPDGMREPDVLGASPGRANDSGRSELDVEEQRRRLRELAGDVTRAAGEGLGNAPPAQPTPQAPQAPNALPANPFGQQAAPAPQAPAPVAASPIPPNPFRQGAPSAFVDDDEEAAQIARVDDALGRLAPGQLRAVQSLPVVGDEDSDENADMLIGAASRMQGVPAAPTTQLRAPMSGPTPTPSARLRAPMVMDDVAPPDETFMPEEEPEMLGARPDPSVRRSVGGDGLGMLGRDLYAQQDAMDRAESERIADQRRRAQIAATIVGLFGQGPDVARAMVAPYDPQAPFARRNEQRMNEFERAMAEQEAALEERRIAQGEAAVEQRAGYRDADILPDHPNAENERRLYAASFAALPEHIRRTFPGFDPSNPSVREAQSQLGAAQIRRQLELLNEQVGVRFPDEADWRSTVSSGGRARRGQLAGFGSQARTVRRGDSGVTPEQLMEMDAAGVDEIDVGGVAQPSAPAPRAPARSMGAPRQQAPTAQQQPAQAPQGRALVDRPMTPDERSRASMDERTTEAAVRAYMLAHAMPESRYGEAAARVNGLTPDQRGQLIRDWGNESMVHVPGWRRVRDTGTLTPQRLTEMRENTTRYYQVATATNRINEIVSQLSAMDLADDAFRGHPLVAEWRSLSRRIQTALRQIDQTGVPTGDEQERAMQEAPEPRDMRSFVAANRVYASLPAALRRNIGVYMQQNGYAPERGGRR